MPAKLDGKHRNKWKHHKFGKNLAGAIKRRMRDTTLFTGDHHATFPYPQILREEFEFAAKTKYHSRLKDRD